LTVTGISHQALSSHVLELVIGLGLRVYHVNLSAHVYKDKARST